MAVEFLRSEERALELSEFRRLEWGHLQDRRRHDCLHVFLPPFIEKFNALHPRIDVKATGYRTQCFSKLRNTQLRIGVSILPIEVHLEVSSLCKE